MSQITVRINKPLLGKNPGDEVKLEADEAGVPLDPVWRRRFNDIPLDECMTVLNGKQAEESSFKKSKD